MKAVIILDLGMFRGVLENILNLYFKNGKFRRNRFFVKIVEWDNVFLKRKKRKSSYNIKLIKLGKIGYGFKSYNYIILSW